MWHRLRRLIKGADNGHNRHVIRDLSEREAKALQPASQHYTAYVGPPDEYDFMGGTQFALLFLLGLRENHKVLDFGCGSLRAGRLLIPYLDPGNYYGIEPNDWLIDDALARQLGGMERLKTPHFSNSDSFEADVFGESFDFIVAQSIFSHSGPALTKKALDSFARVLQPKGLCTVTFREGDEDTPEGWFYTGLTDRGTVRYRPSLISGLAADAGFKAARLPWRHPRLSWWLLGWELPPPDSLAELVGRLP
jgi:SAM-dependent methyltransferase